MSPLERVYLGVGLWIALVLLARWVVVPLLRYGPERDPTKVLLWRSCQLYSILMHRVQYRGLKAIRHQIDPGPMVVVSNHTSAVDPVLLQCGCKFAIRWLMARDMMNSQLDWLWNLQSIIPVSRDGSDSAPVREAIRHVRKGGAVGIFPEARIVKPRGEIRPFLAGVGAIVARTNAPVMVVWISGTPEVDDMTQAFFTPSRSRVQYVEMMKFPKSADPIEITERIRKRLAKASKWPLNDEPMPALESDKPSVIEALTPTIH